MSEHDETFAIAELAAPDGAAVILHHGTPESRVLADWWDEPLRRRGLRLVAFDRPGYGERPARPGRRVVDVARDVEALADRLGLERFATVGFSGGGPHALATAAMLPSRVIAAATIAGVGPHGVEGLDFLAGMGEGNVEEFGLALEGPERLVPYLENERAELVGATAESLLRTLETLLSPADVEALDARGRRIPHRGDSRRARARRGRLARRRPGLHAAVGIRSRIDHGARQHLAGQRGPDGAAAARALARRSDPGR
jgi:pimeloyl-ACP methyl ester carboxylesterase